MTREALYANTEEVGRLDGTPLVGDEILEDMQQLIEAHHAYDEAEGLHKTEIDSLSAQIKELEQQKQQLVTSRENEKDQQHRKRHTFSYRVEEALKDPQEGTHPVYATVLRAPSLDQGSLWYPDTFTAAEKLARNLTELSQTLEQAGEPQPVVMATWHELYSSEDIDNFSLGYGFTKPSAELTPHNTQIRTGVCGCGAPHSRTQPHLSIPVVEQTVGAVVPSRWHSEYVRSDGRKISLEGGRREEEIAPNYKKVGIQPFNVTLPTGNLYKDEYDLGRYDKDGKIVELVGPMRFLGNERSYFAIGSKAVSQTLESFTKEITPTVEHPKMYRDMFKFVAKALNLKAKP